MDTAHAIAAARPPEDFEARRIAAAVRARFLGTPPATIGRYRIEARIGGGGSGLVYRALDPQLRRRVAIKLLHAHADAIVDEAAALAQVDHPGVVRVFDVLRTEHGIVLVMELVEGTTLRDVLRSLRSDREVLALFVAAGRGLAHMHEIGLVHRDFKPDNVVVDRTGAARIIDFGLVRAVGSETRPGEGTPGYAAPEQIAGGPADPRSDQYSFCAALIEALPRGPLRRACLPVLRRGTLDDRWPTMTALLDALPTRSSRRPWWAFAAIACATLGAALWAHAAAPAPCEGQLPHALAWDRTSVSDALGDGEPVLERLDAFTEAWARARAELCTADPEPPRVGCLLDAADELDAIAAATIERPNAALAWQAAVRLPEPRTCVEGRVPAFYGTRPDADTRAAKHRLAAARVAFTTGDHAKAATESDAIWRLLEGRGECRVAPRAALLAGFANAALDERVLATDWLDRALWAAMRCGDDVIVADAASLAVSQGDRRAFDRYGPVAEAALAAQQWPPQPTANYLLAACQAKLERGDTAAAIADARRGLELMLEASGPDSIDAIAFHTALGGTLASGSELDEAVEHIERAYELSLQHHGPDHSSTSRALMNLGALQSQRGYDREAEVALTRALEARRAQFGDAHPELLVPLLNLASTHISLRRWEEARVDLEEALAILEREPEPQLEGFTVERLGIVAMEQGRFEDASQLLERARVHRIEHFGADHSEVAWSLVSLSIMHAKQGHTRETEQLLLDAAAIASAHGADDPELVGLVDERLGALRAEQGLHAKAIEHYERVVALRRAVGRRGGDIGVSLLGLAEAHAALGDRPRALEYAAQARKAYADVDWTWGIEEVDAFLDHIQTQTSRVAKSQPVEPPP